MHKYSNRGEDRFSPAMSELSTATKIIQGQLSSMSSSSTSSSALMMDEVATLQATVATKQQQQLKQIHSFDDGNYNLRFFCFLSYYENLLKKQAP